MAGLFQNSINRILYSPERPSRPAPSNLEAKNVCGNIRRLLDRFENGATDVPTSAGNSELGMAPVTAPSTPKHVAQFGDELTNAIQRPVYRRVINARLPPISTLTTMGAESPVDCVVSSSPVARPKTEGGRVAIRPFGNAQGVRKQFADFSHTDVVTRGLNSPDSPTIAKDFDLGVAPVASSTDRQAAGRYPAVERWSMRRDALTARANVGKGFGELDNDANVLPGPTSSRFVTPELIETPILRSTRPRVSAPQRPSDFISLSRMDFECGCCGKFESDTPSEESSSSTTTETANEYADPLSTPKRPRSFRMQPRPAHLEKKLDRQTEISKIFDEDETLQEAMNRILGAPKLSFTMMKNDDKKCGFCPKARQELLGRFQQFYGNWTVTTMRGATDLILRRLRVIEAILEPSELAKRMIRLYSECVKSDSNEHLWVLCVALLDLNKELTTKKLSEHEIYIAHKFGKSVPDTKH